MGFTNMMIMLLGGPLLQPFIGYLLDKLNFTGTTMQFQLALSPLSLAC